MHGLRFWSNNLVFRKSIWKRFVIKSKFAIQFAKLLAAEMEGWNFPFLKLSLTVPWFGWHTVLKLNLLILNGKYLNALEFTWRIIFMDYPTVNTYMRCIIYHVYLNNIYICTYLCTFIHVYRTDCVIIFHSIVLRVRVASIDLISRDICIGNSGDNALLTLSLITSTILSIWKKSIIGANYIIYSAKVKKDDIIANWCHILNRLNRCKPQPRYENHYFKKTKQNEMIT